MPSSRRSLCDAYDTPVKTIIIYRCRLIEREREKLQNTKNIFWNIDFLNYFHLSSVFFPFACNCVQSHAAEVCYYI